MVDIFFIKGPAVAAVNACIVLRSTSQNRQKEGVVTSYCKAVKYLLERFAPDHVFAKTDDDMMRCAKRSSKRPTESDDDLWNEVLRCDRVYDKNVLKRISVKGLLESIRRTMDSY